ncbi:MAG: hypothetical protein IJM78_04385 [Prevotella sp.]|nr:hypothetical protein [Prevotella sp.]
MKKRLLTMAALLAMVFTMQAQETTKIMVVTGNDGKVYRKAVKDVKDITFVDESYEYVDLGLPEEYGDYFAWGETEPYYTEGNALSTASDTWKTGKTGYNWASYFDTPSGYTSGTPTYFTTYNTASAQLQSQHDVATAKWGSAWCMPTHAQLQELVANTVSEWGTLNGVNGRYFYKKDAGGSKVADTYIFLPAAGYRHATSLDSQGSYGYYWSSELHSSSVDRAWLLYFDSGSVYAENYDGARYNGLSVRAVCAQ